MKIAVCDDNLNELELIRTLLDIYKSDSIQTFTVKCFESSVELASTLRFEKFDIYILDIIMPVMDGLTLAKEIRTFDKAAPIIFLTASPEFAVDSYTVKAFNYLLKPVVKERLYSTLDDIIETFHQESTNNIIIKNSTGIHKIHTSDIINSACATTCKRNQKTVSDFSDGRLIHKKEGIYMDGLSAMLNLVNYVFVLIFGIVVSFYFADITWEDNKKTIISTLVAFALLQAVCYVLLGERILYKSYPFIIHIPLILVIRYVCHKNIYISTIAVLSAYLMCTPRKWFGTVAAYIIKDIPMISDIVTIIITIPLLFIVIKYISPYIIKLENESKTILSIFFFLPLTYYVSEYAFTVYTDLLYRGEAIVIEFMDSFIVILYFLLSIVTLTILNRKNAAERENIILLASAAQAEKEISQLYEYQRQAAIYRHDLRHHMNFLQSCLNENKYTQAQDYIKEICTNLDNSRITRYCDNEAVNLILSSYIDSANEYNIITHVSVTAGNLSDYKPTDLCSLLANALENAINACKLVQTAPAAINSNRIITVKVFDKNNKLCINITNTYAVEPVFVNNTPVSDKAGHGIGIRSIISVIEKYNGVYDFFTEDGLFYFQACI